MDVFHVAEAGTSDAQLAGLLQDAARIASDHGGTRQPGKVVGAMAAALDPAHGKQLGAVEGLAGLNHSQRLAVGDVLAAGLARAQAGQHPAADRLAEVADRWSQFTAAGAVA